MHNFSYSKVQDKAAAIEALQDNPNGQFIAGGTNLVDLMKYRVEAPDVLIDLNHLALSQIESLPEGGLRLGAMATNADTAYHQIVERNYPVLSEAILSAASAQLRNMATNGGNLLQRTRCYYFYDTSTPCNKRVPGSGCSAINGFNRIHAILGASEHCIATHPSDMCVALAALDATINVEGKNGARKIPILDFHRLPGNQPEKDTNLQKEEIITAVDLPAENFSTHYKYLKVRDRTSYAFAIVSVAACLKLEGDHIIDVRVALGGVAHKPWRRPDVEEKYKNTTASAEQFRSLAEDLLAGAQGYGHNDFKIELAKQSIVRALQDAKSK